MYIMKVHKSQRYSTANIKEGGSVDFDANWLDETSLGTTDLAKREKAWDRLGTALENEMDSIIYLHHICSDGSLETGGHKCGE